MRIYVEIHTPARILINHWAYLRAMDKHPLRYRYHRQSNIATLLIAALYILVTRDVFLLLGFPPLVVFLLLLASYLGSDVNIPLYSVESTFRENILPLHIFGLRFALPRFVRSRTLIAVNVGGAVVPVVISVLLLLLDPLAFLYLPVPLAVVSIVVNWQARLVPGVGITLPTLFAPSVSIGVSVLFLALTSGLSHLVAVVYITSSVGSLIGADLMNLRKIPQLGSPMVSIGGAGTFDGVFMGGIYAITLVGMFLPQLVQG